MLLCIACLSIPSSWFVHLIGPSRKDVGDIPSQIVHVENRAQESVEGVHRALRDLQEKLGSGSPALSAALINFEEQIRRVKTDQRFSELCEQIQNRLDKEDKYFDELMEKRVGDIAAMVREVKEKIGLLRLRLEKAKRVHATAANMVEETHKKVVTWQQFFTAYEAVMGKDDAVEKIRGLAQEAIQQLAPFMVRQTGQRPESGRVEKKEAVSNVAQLEILPEVKGKGLVLVNGGMLPASSKLGLLPVDTFYIGKTEVTWGEWQTVCTWAVANGYTDLANVGKGEGDNYPVCRVNWYDVVKWCNARSEREGKTPVYKDGTEVYRTGEVSDPMVVHLANGYRLPSDAEWEFAARGGLQTNGYKYSGSNDLNVVGWWYGNSGGAVHEVGMKKVNELGISDMSGNLWEFSGSWHPDWEGSCRVIRGGGWIKGREDCAVTHRSYNYPEYRYYDFGFRVALSLIPEMVLVSGGTLPVSSPLGAFPVDTFYIGKTEVTWVEWKAVRTWAVANGYSDLDGVGQGVGDSYPVSHVNWYDVVKWCNARSEKERKTPVYKNGTDVYRTGEVSDPMVVSSADGYRLPSDVEWEFAARGGTQGNSYKYSGSNNLSEVGWYSENSGGAVKEVGKKLGNELGICDVSGNLWEWIGSWHSGFAGSDRVIRGGNWYGGAEHCAVANRGNGNPRNRNGYYGFRVVLSSVP